MASVFTEPVVPLSDRKVLAGETPTPEHKQMALDNKGLIAWTIEHFGIRTDTRYTFDDACQDGWFGLVRAAQKFDAARGRFASYAIHHIRAEIHAGQGRFEGLNFRHDLWSGREHTRPLSIDFAYNTSSLPMHDLVPDGSAAVEHQVVNIIDLDLMRRIADALCDDDADRHFISSILDPYNDQSKAALERELVQNFGLTANQARSKVRTLTANLRRRLKNSSDASEVLRSA